MSEEKPDPLSDVIKGLGLILRAAKTTVERMPKKGLEDAVLETAREVGRAIENVAGVVEREVLGRKASHGSNEQDKDAPSDADEKKADDKPQDPPPPPRPGAA
jgi:hypothetical protein